MKPLPSPLLRLSARCPLCERRQRLAKLPSEMRQRRFSLVHNAMPKALKPLWSQPANCGQSPTELRETKADVQ